MGILESSLESAQKIFKIFYMRSIRSSWKFEPILEESQGKIQSPELVLTGDVNSTITEFPFRTTYTPTDNSLKVSCSGSTPLYFTAFARKWNTNPQAKRDLYNISTSFAGQKGSVVNLEAGELITMDVALEVKKKGDYVMIEIPIPAGCTGLDAIPVVHRL